MAAIPVKHNAMVFTEAFASGMTATIITAIIAGRIPNTKGLTSGRAP